MKITGSANLNAPVEAVWAALNDPAVLVRTIPGCERLEEVGQDRYRMTITAGVASIKGSYDGEVALAEQQPPSSFVLRASGAGAPGTVQADVTVTLAPDGADGSGTVLRYDADAVVGGMVGGVGQRMLTGVAKKTAGEFFKAVDGVLTGAAPAEAIVTGAPAAAAAPGVPAVLPAPSAALGAPAAEAGPRVFAAPAKPAPAGAPWWQLFAAFGFGAFWGLAGVVLGSRIARRR
jgi:uncharacterized protein